MATETKLWCSAHVFSGARYDFGGHRCTKPVKVTLNGKSYCAIHDPAHVEAQKQERNRVWQAERVAERRKRDARDEQARRAEAYPELLATLKALVDWAAFESSWARAGKAGEEPEGHPLRAARDLIRRLEARAPA